MGAMDTKIGVNLAFSADTTKVKSQLTDLQNQLTKLVSVGASGKGVTGINSEIQESIASAAKLKVQLEAATNVRTGQLDLSKFNESLKKSGMTLQQYGQQLSNLGPAGDQAFAQLSKAIVNAEMPLKKSSALLTNFANTLKNTIKWQISSSMVHGFMGAIQGAYGYAQSLDKSLNNIRIVTGQSAEQMAIFAKEANKAARELSTTTVAYTDAALIFYQQGLDDEAVKARTDATIKMANVTGDSATEVSSYMTAIWNNFAKGSNNLEHFSDVITALGASTASSSEEIAGGLEKFAAVGNTIGLSYEYAATSLATIVAATRQSEDTVGTALKTIFSRIQGLKLGETLDDGTELNKYSNALLAVGVNIKDVNGEIKDMDTILNELGSRWKMLTKDQQMALAQTVAGTRQYTQLVALMAHWEEFQENLTVAQNSDGSLDKQAKIYADSWESAQKRVRTAAQNIYSSLIDEKFFIKGLGWMEKFLDSINNIIKGLGGIQGIVPLIGGLLMKAFSKDMVNGINSMTYNLKMLTPSGRASEKQMKSEANSLLTKQALDAASNTGTSVQGDVYAGQAQAQKILIENAERLSAEDQKIVSILMDQREILGQQWVESQKVAEAAAKEVTTRAEILQHENPGLFKTKAKTEAYLKLDQQIEECAKELSQLQAAEKKLGAISQTESKNVQKVAASIKSVLQETGQFSKYEKKFEKALAGGVSGLKEFAKKTELASGVEKKFQKLVGNFTKMLVKRGKSEKQAAKEAQEMANAHKKNADAMTAENIARKNYQESLSTINSFVQESITRSTTFGDVVLGVGKGITSLSMAINSLSGLSDVWSDDDVSIGQKLLSTITTLGFTLPMVGGAINSLLKPMMTARAESIAINAVNTAKLKIDGKLNAEKIQEAILQKAILEGREKENIGILTTIEGLDAEQKARYADAYATDAERKAIEKAKKAQDSFNLSVLSNPIILTAAIVLGIIAAIGVGIAANAKKEREENAKTAEMLQKQSEKRSQEAKDRLAEIDSLVEKYNELSESYINNETSLSQLQVEMYNQLEALGMHAEAVEALTGSYEELDKIMRQAQINANNEVIKAGEENLKRTLNYFQAELHKNLDSDERDTTYFGKEAEASIDIRSGEDIDQYQDEQFVAFSKELEALGIKSHYEDEVSEQQFYGHISEDDFVRIASENSDVLRNILSKYASGDDGDTKDAAQQLLGYLDTYSDKINAYQNETKSVQNAKLSNIGLENYQKGTITNIEEYNAKIKELTEKANEVLHDEVKAKKWAESYLAKDNSVTDIIRKDALRTSTRRKIAGSTDEEINKFLDNADEEILLSLNFDEGSTLEQVQKLYEVAQNELDRKKLEANVELIDNVSNKILSNESIDEETLAKLKEQYTDYDWDSFLGLNKKEQIEELNKLLIENDRIRRETYENEKKYMDSKDEQYEKDNDLLKKKEAELAKFKEVTTGSGRSYEIEYYKYAQKKTEELSEEIAVLKKNMETLSNVEYDTNPFNEFMKEITSDVDQIVRYTEDVKSGAKLIGEGYIVAKEDIQSFMKVYPEMAALAQVNADGSLQLNQEIVQQYLDGDKAKIEADASVIRTQLENQAMVLQSEIEYKKRKIENLKAFINGDIDYSTFKQNQDEEDTNHAKELMKIATDAQISNDQLAAASNDELTKAELENVDAMGKKVNDLGNAIVAALSGEGGTYEANGVAGIKHADLFDKLHMDAETTSEDLSKQLASVRSEAEAVEVYRKQALLSLESEEAALASLEEDAANVNLQISRLNNGVNSAISAFNGAGKGNGSSDKSKIKNLDDEIDRYHVIKNQLEDLEAQLDRISKAKERAFGAEKLNLIQQEIDAQKQLLAGNEEYLRQVSGNLGNERNALHDYYGAEFDANGTITNYNALIASQIATYNAMGGSEEAEEAYNKFKDLLSKYEEDQDSFKELQQNIIDKKNEIYDLMLEKTQYSVEWKINVEDRELTYLEYLLERIENRAFSAAEAIANIGLQTEHLFNKSGANKSGILGLLQNHGYSAQDAQGILSQMESDTLDTNALKDILQLTQGELDALDGWVDDLMSINQQLYEMRDKVWEDLNKEFEEYNTKMEDGISKMEHLKSVIQSYQNIIGIVGKKTLGVTNDFINYLNNTIAQQSRNVLASNKAELDAIKKAREDLAATFDENWTEEDKKKWQEQMDTIENKYREVESSFMSSWEEALQSAADAWKASVDNIIEDFSKKLAGTAGSLALLREQYDRTVEIDDRYLDDYEKIYHLTKLTREVGKAIDSTDNLNAKKELRELQEEILEMQKEGKEISQYDLDYETKKFELKQAQLALNEAQNAKSNITMVRGDDGTYGYVYTADANAVENAEQNYEDKLYEMQKLNGDYIKSLQDNIIKAEEECMNAIQELNVADFANYEEYQARVDEITAYYQGKMGYYSSEMDKVLGNNRKLYIEDWQAYHDATGYKISEDQNYIDSFNETALSTLTGFQTMEEYQRAFNQTIGSPNDPNSLLGQLANNYNEWKDSVDLAMKAAGTSTENFSNKLDTEVNGQNGIKNNSEEAMRSVEEMAKDMQTAFAETINTVGQWASDYGTKIGEMISANDKLIASYNALRTAMGLKTTSSVQNTPLVPSNPGPTNPNQEDTGNGGGASANGGKFISEPAHYDADGRTDANNPPAATNGTFYLVDTAPNKKYPYGIAKRPGARRYGWVSAFKTGGYTGDWTGEGKLALLHQKEMVLNSEDTSNMLSIVDMVRQIAKVIDLNAAAASGMYSSMSSAYRVAGNNGAVQQEVTVYADFPGITSADGLEDAFKNIASDALHYINRNF